MFSSPPFPIIPALLAWLTSPTALSPAFATTTLFTVRSSDSTSATGSPSAARWELRYCENLSCTSEPSLSTNLGLSSAGEGADAERGRLGLSWLGEYYTGINHPEDCESHYLCT